ncbi:MAG: spore protease YyaC [Clostridia bacterium]
MEKSTIQDVLMQVVVVCFGTPCISGDALGPAVGSLLQSKYRAQAFVYGTLEKPINGRNMAEWINFVFEAHSDAIILAVDAGLGAKSKIGQISVRADGVCPAAVKGQKVRFGDVGILGIVGESGKDALMELLQVSSVYVDDMADKVAFMINNTINSLRKPNLEFA